MKQVNIGIPSRILALLVGLVLSIGAFAQITVQGNVKDASGEPVIGASIKVVGTTTGTVTDFDGNFTLNNIQPGAKLLITSIGLADQEVAAAPELNITMLEDSEVLSEVVVIGYGTVKKSDLTGSVTNLKPDSKNKGLVVSAQDMLGGKIAGVNVVSNGGTPGGSSTIRIRGGSSISASSDPLIVIDGVPMDNYGVKGFPNGLGIVNPQDIESFNVLKDASATAIYGSRGSNGVIIITTKKGTKGQRMRVSYNGSYTVSKKRKTIDVMNGDEYREFVKALFKGADNEAVAVGLLGTANTNWQDEIHRTAHSHDHNLTLTGSIGRDLPFRVSLGYTNQQGIIKTSSFERFTTSVNLNPQLFDNHLVMNLNARWMWAKNRYADGGAISNAVRMDPTQPITNGNKNTGGYFEWLATFTDEGDPEWPTVTNTNAPRNPVAILQLKNDRARSHSFVGSADFDYKIHGFEDLRLHLTLGGDFSGGKQDTDVSPYSNLANYYGSHGWSDETKENMSLSAYAQYYKDFSDDHHFDIMAGYEWSHVWRMWYNRYWGVYPLSSTRKFPAGHEYAGLSMAGSRYNDTSLYDGRGDRTENYLVSYFGRANYIFKERYYLTATVRYDGSSRVYDHWALFPSFAAAWSIKKESFLRDSNAVSDLKLRLGWGKTGQQDIGDYNYFANYVVNTGVQGSWYDVYGDGSMMRPNAYNKKLKWETTTTTNVGLDFGFMNQRLTGTIDWYYRKTTDLINYANVAALTNFRNRVNQNVAEMHNTGIEFALSYKAIQTQDWNWTIDYNFTYNKNRVDKLLASEDESYNIPNSGISAGTGNIGTAHKTGETLNSFWVYQQVYDQNGHPIENQVVDRNADGIINNDDRYYYKSPMAPVTMGLSTRLEWKNWDLGLNFRANIGNYVFNDVMDGYHNTSRASVMENVSGNYLNNRPVAAVALGWQTYDEKSALSDYWVQNASFLKCDNITLGFSFRDLFHTSSYEGIYGRIYATVSNVFTITKYKGIDPEVSGGIDNNIYPRPISFILGLSLNF